MKERDFIDPVLNKMNECRSTAKGPSAFSFFTLLLLVFFVSCLTSAAQVSDTIRAAFHKKPRPIGGFSTKNTFINGFISPIYTVRAGVDFNHRVRIGAGLSWLDLSPYRAGKDNSPFYLDHTFTDVSGTHTVHPALKFSYVNFFIEYVYYKSHKWQFSVPLQFGVGGSSYSYNYNGVDIVENKHSIFLYEPVVTGQYRIIRWFGISLDVGYRIMLIGNKKMEGKFNSPIYNAGVVIYWGELYRIVFHRKG